MSFQFLLRNGRGNPSDKKNNYNENTKKPKDMRMPEIKVDKACITYIPYTDGNILNTRSVWLVRTEHGRQKTIWLFDCLTNPIIILKITWIIFIPWLTHMFHKGLIGNIGMCKIRPDLINVRVRLGIRSCGKNRGTGPQIEHFPLLIRLHKRSDLSQIGGC